LLPVYLKNSKVIIIIIIIVLNQPKDNYGDSTRTQKTHNKITDEKCKI